MPRFQLTRSVATADVSAIRVRCDGCDGARPCDEHAPSAMMWLVTAGAFELRNTVGRHMIDPTRAIVMPAGHAFQIRHPAGPDVCVAFRGPVVDALAGHGPRLVELGPAQLARITRALDRTAPPSGSAAGRGSPAVDGDDDLALGEALAQLDDAPVTRTDPRDLAAAITDVLRARYAESTSLGELAATTGYSVFHACRVFRAITGTTIHGFRRELRLRHALARILDSRDSLSEIAADTGFASQSHLTNLFRARFGITPSRARTPDGARALQAAQSVG